MSSTPAYTLPGLTDFHLRPYELAQTLHDSVLDAASAHSLYGLNLTHDFFELSDAAFIAAWQLQNPGQPIPASLHITRSLPDFISPANMNNMNALQQPGHPIPTTSTLLSLTTCIPNSLCLSSKGGVWLRTFTPNQFKGCSEIFAHSCVNIFIPTCMHCFRLV
jgi:hypothetical protein